MDQAPEAVLSIEDRIAALDKPVEEPKEDAPQEPQAQEETTEAPVEEAAEVEEPEDILTPEQLQHYKVKVKIDGDEKEVSLEEARLGYMRLEDYTRKTQEISKQREEVPTKVKAEVEKVQKEYEANVKLFHQAYFQLAGDDLNNVDWNKLAEEDPAEFVKKSHKAQKIQNALRGAKQEMERIEAERKAEHEKYLAQAIPQAVEKLQKAIPNWSNDLYQKVLKNGVETYGFSQEEVANTIDDRMIRVLHDAMQLRELKDKKSIVDKKVADVPKVLKPGTQQSKSLVNAEKDKELRTNLRKSGSVEDLAAILRARQRR